MKVILLLLIVTITLIIILVINSHLDPNNISIDPVESELVNYTYQIIDVYPHDESAFTQGLVFENGFLYEGTGLKGRSTLRRVEIETGIVTQIHSLSAEFFGEGITIFEDKIIQLTWKNNIGFVYEKTSFELLQTFNYSTLGWGSSTQGWGLTHDNNNLIMSVGNETLYFLNPQTFNIESQIDVYNQEKPVKMLNELEYINGSIYANIWQEDIIAKINAKTGVVTGWIDFSSLKDLLNQTDYDVLNGIAYNPNKKTLLVTGKNWSKLFEIKLVPEK
ncbi:glutaminyl-peptide cyclotransferase [Candidatus Bathyarchaeota archaeon]|nr:glutaminyl-peptide cyclotransferase [Candidatus Bathyarchaeota archaeon]